MRNASQFKTHAALWGRRGVRFCDIGHRRCGVTFAIPIGFPLRVMRITPHVTIAPSLAQTLRDDGLEIDCKSCRERESGNYFDPTLKRALACRVQAVGARKLMAAAFAQHGLTRTHCPSALRRRQ